MSKFGSKILTNFDEYILDKLQKLPMIALFVQTEVRRHGIHCHMIARELM
jgi:hypothetical protein